MLLSWWLNSGQLRRPVYLQLSINAIGLHKQLVFLLIAVVMNNGKSRGYGFVRFASEADQDRALIEMQNYSGLGYKPIRVSLAIPKRYTADGQLIQAAKDEQAAAASSSSLVPSGNLSIICRCTTGIIEVSPIALSTHTS